MRSSMEEYRGSRLSSLGIWLPAATLVTTVTVHSCAQMLQKLESCGVGSIIDSSSLPHFGHRAAWELEVGTLGVDTLPAAIARPVSSRSPFTYMNPRRTWPSGWIRHSQWDTCTSIGAKRTPWRCASLTSVAG